MLIIVCGKNAHHGILGFIPAHLPFISFLHYTAGAVFSVTNSGIISLILAV